MSLYGIRRRTVGNSPRSAANGKISCGVGESLTVYIKKGLQTMSKQYWWKDRAWRTVQTNLREIDMADMNAEQYVRELQEFNANTVIINTGGIVASYESEIPFHTRNRFLTGDSLETVVRACKAADIRVVSRVDFSKVRTPLYEQHPEWAYVSPKGKIIDYHGLIHMCFNSDYQQKIALDILREIIRKVDPDGIFLNMGGYSVALDYTLGYQGICQCENCRKRFRDMFGLELPKEDNPDDPTYQKYREFQRITLNEYYQNIKKLITEEKPELLFFHIDMLRGEIGTFFDGADKNNYMYKGSEILKLEKYSDPEMVASVTSVDFIDMWYRHAAVSPHEQELRLAQMLSNGGFADFYQVGRLDNHPDKSGYAALKKMFRYHLDHEEDYHANYSAADIALISPRETYWSKSELSFPGEYYGWYHLLTQQHYIFDCIKMNAVENVSLEKYKTIILPDVQDMSDAGAKKLDAFAAAGGTVIATGETSMWDERRKKRQAIGLACLGVENVGYVGHDYISAYFEIGDSKHKFPRFADTDWIYLHDVYCYAEYKPGVKENMRLIPPHRHSPPEDAYPTNITSYPAFTVNEFGKGRGVYVPWKPGADHYHFGFPHMGNFMADLLENVLDMERVTGNLPEMVEVEHTVRRDGSVDYVHLINYTGCSLKSYFPPVPIHDLVLELPWKKDVPGTAYSMTGEKPVRFEFREGKMTLFIDELTLFEAIRIV